MKKSTFRSLLWVIKLQFKASKFYTIWTVLDNAYTGVISIVNTFVLAKLISSVSAVALNKASPGSFYRYLILLLAIEIISIILNNINHILERRSQQKVDNVASEMFFNKMYELSQEQFENETFNTKLSRASDSLNQLWRVISELSNLISYSVRFIASISAIIFIAPIVGIIIIIAVIPITILNVRQNKSHEATNKKTEPFDRIASRSQWMLLDTNDMPEIRLMNAFKKLIHSWRTNTNKSQEMYFDYNKRQLKFYLISETFEPLVSFFANIYFFRLLVKSTISLDRFIFLRGILEQASGSAGQVANSLQQLHDLSINLDNFNEVFEAKPAFPNGTVKVERPLTIEFKNVSFKYPSKNQLILNDVSFLIVPGSRLALVGENGAGKSTLLKLLLRQYLPTSGNIIVNGTDIKDVEQESYYSAISNLSQDFLIVNHLTIKDNLLMGIERTVNDTEIYKNTDYVGATDFIKKLAHKLDQRLDASFDDGTMLSGGQMQRLGVARALLRGGDVMLLDEPTSAIDAKAEYDIFNNIYKAHEGKTTLIVSHRFSTVRKADMIIVMEKGKITEYGSHEDLIKYGGLYKEMFEIQAEGYK